MHGEREIGAKPQAWRRYFSPNVAAPTVAPLARVSSAGRGLLGLGQSPGHRGIDRDAGAHRGGEGDLPQIPALGGGRLEPDHLVDRGRVVLDQRAVVERRLADDEVQAAMPVHPELDLAALDVGY